MSALTFLAKNFSLTLPFLFEGNLSTLFCVSGNLDMSRCPPTLFFFVCLFFCAVFFRAVNNLQFLCNYFVREFRAACFVRLSVLHLFARVKYFFSHFRMNFVKYFLSHPRDKKNNCMSKKICGQRQKYLPTPFCLYPRAPKRYYASLCLVHQIALCDLFFCTLSQHACPHTQNTACSKCKLLKHVSPHFEHCSFHAWGTP